MIVMWERNKKEFTFLDRVTICPATFHSLPVIDGTTDAVDAIYKAMLPTRALIERDGRQRWHAVDRQALFGITVYQARPIVIRLHAATAA